MEHIRKQANVAHRRLTAERFFGYLPWTCCIALGVGLVGMFLPKLVPITVDTTVWYVSWMVAPLVIALVTTLALTLTGRPSAADAAAEIDKRFALRERLSSALMLTPQDRETELGQALVVDANKRAETLDVRDKFQWGLSPKLLLPLVPALLTALFWLVPNREQPESFAQKNGTSITQVKNSMKPLLEQIKKKREDA